MSYQIVTDGLVACWDQSTWTSGTTWTDKISNKKITFSSAPSSKTTDGIELTSSITFTSESLSSLGLSKPCTFEWLGRIDGAFNNSSPGNVFGLNTSNGTWSGGILCYSKTSSNGVQLDLSSSGSITSKVYTAGIEYHIIVTVSGTTTTLYVNSTTAKGTSTKSSGYANKYYLFNNEGSGRFYGAISRMSLWNKCLSSTEIQTLFTEEVLTTYSVDISSSGEGTTNPTGTQTVTEGESLTITMTPNNGASVKVSVDGTEVTPTKKSSGGTVEISASASYGTYAGSYSNMLDGDTSTYWWSNAAQSVGSYVLFTFDKLVTLNSVTAICSYNTDYVYSGTAMQVSSDGSTWTSCGYFDGTSNSTVQCSVTDKIQYVRFYVESATNKWLCISEVQFDYSVEETVYYEYEINAVNDNHSVTVIYVSGSGVYIKTESGWKELVIYVKKETGYTKGSSSNIVQGTNYLVVS